VCSACIDVPTLPVVANAVASPAAPTLNVLAYTYQCAYPGFAGITQNYSFVAPNSFAFATAPVCTTCNRQTEFSRAPSASGFAGFQCNTCASVDPNLKAAAAIPGFTGSMQCGCAANFYSNGAAAESQLTCTACPTGSSLAASAASTQCVCNANFQTSYSGVPGGPTLVCSCLNGYQVQGTGSSATCGLIPTQTATMSSTASASATATMTSSASATATATASNAQAGATLAPTTYPSTTLLGLG
jgi:hypothetical protein